MCVCVGAVMVNYSACCGGVMVFVVVVVQVKCEQNQKALKMVLEDSTLEEAMWALGQVTGICHLSLRPRQDGTSPHHDVFFFLILFFTSKLTYYSNKPAYKHVQKKYRTLI